MKGTIKNVVQYQETKQHYLDLLESQRQFLASPNKNPQLDETPIRQQIDLEEERIKMI